jgi:hypothetical protein
MTSIMDHTIARRKGIRDLGTASPFGHAKLVNKRAKLRFPNNIKKNYYEFRKR